MKKFTVEIKAGDEILVGRFRNVATKIKSIEVDEKGQPILVTSKGRKNLFSCRISKLDPDTGKLTPKEIMKMRKE
tara:strand:+ start:138 stop:362 length:225 start_codon:yes stop_codon:yes gene_type:complete